MRLVRLLPGLFLAASLACASTSPLALRAAAESELPAARAPGDLRLMTFNIQSGRRGLDGVVEVIRAAAPDVVALQEVDRGSRRSQGLDQSAVLAERTRLPYQAHFRTVDMHGGSYGVAMLSRYPLESVAQYPLPVPEGVEPRTMAHAVMRVGGREVSIYVTHLTRQPFYERVRMLQSVAILKVLGGDPRPKLLLGDLNAAPDSGAVRLLKRELTDVFEARGKGPEGTFPLPLFLPTLRLDYVLAGGAVMPLRSKVLRVDASDHYPVVADVALLAPTQTPAAEVVRRPASEAPPPPLAAD